MIELYHTSPDEITSITKNGRFGEFLFFASSEYVTTATSHICYRIELAQDQIIEASSLFWHEDAEHLGALVTELAEQFGVDENDAEKLIAESASIYDVDSNVEPEDIGEASWEIQRFTARAAKLLGFRGVSVSDEQGTAYMIDMLGRECDLVKA